MSVLKLYLAALFALPLIDLWDRWIASKAEKLFVDTAFREDRWLSILEGDYLLEGRLLWCRVWVFRIPFVTTWGPVINNYRREMGWRTHHLCICWQNRDRSPVWISPPFG